MKTLFKKIGGWKDVLGSGIKRSEDLRSKGVVETGEVITSEDGVPECYNLSHNPGSDDPSIQERTEEIVERLEHPEIDQRLDELI